jgi:hypothetical protein
MDDNPWFIEWRVYCEGREVARLQSMPVIVAEVLHDVLATEDAARAKEAR